MFTGTLLSLQHHGDRLGAGYRCGGSRERGAGLGQGGAAGKVRSGLNPDNGPPGLQGCMFLLFARLKG